MSQIHCYVPKEIESELRARAQARRLPLSRYVAELLTKDVRQGWPKGYFEDVIGGWKGPDLERPPQGASEKRASL